MEGKKKSEPMTDRSEVRIILFGMDFLCSQRMPNYEVLFFPREQKDEYPYSIDYTEQCTRFLRF